MDADILRTLGLYLAAAMAISLVLGLLLFLFVVRLIRRIDVPPGADFTETLLYTPFIVAITIDLLDFALDILAAPFSWVILDRLGLKALRGLAAVEAVLPFTQFIPTMTLCWFGARFFGKTPGSTTKPKYIIDQ
ncbi:MAG: hypothetical protein IAF02_19885 [Anaerolineae bacterium]|nr:hypothetical protein [Anaerolineae bacterium]